MVSIAVHSWRHEPTPQQPVGRPVSWLVDPGVPIENSRHHRITNALLDRRRRHSARLCRISTGCSPLGPANRPCWSCTTELAPFLLTSPVEDLVVFEAGWLGEAGLEELLALGALTGLRLWLVLGEDPSPACDPLLRGQCLTWISLDDARRAWRDHDQLELVADDTYRVGRTVALGETFSEVARLDVFTALRAAEPRQRQLLSAAHTRRTVQPAAAALRQAVTPNERLLLKLKVRDVSIDASMVTVGRRVYRLPASSRGPVQRQRLHALLVGQRMDEQLLTYDGNLLCNL